MGHHESIYVYKLKYCFWLPGALTKDDLPASRANALIKADERTNAEAVDHS